MQLPDRVTLRECGPRDGWQNIAEFIPTADKIKLINALAATGVPRLELTSFVHPRWVPQLADAEAVCRGVRPVAGCAFSVLIPNQRGLDRALAVRAAGAPIAEILVVVSASEEHNRRNLNRSVSETLAELAEVTAAARRAGLRVTGVVSTSFGCPYAGRMPPERVAAAARAYQEMGADAVSLGDTTGMANPLLVARVVAAVRAAVGDLEVGLHFHNTRGAALANVLAGLQAGITHFEAAYGELGGCQFAAGATGNIATEDLVNMLHEMGIATGVDLERLLAVSRQTQALLGRPLESHLLRAGPPCWQAEG